MESSEISKDFIEYYESVNGVLTDREKALVEFIVSYTLQTVQETPETVTSK